MYDPSIGRWLEEDPLSFEAGDSNLYRYVGNGPTNALDPEGLQQPSNPQVYTPPGGPPSMTGPAGVRPLPGQRPGGILRRIIGRVTIIVTGSVPTPQPGKPSPTHTKPGAKPKPWYIGGVWIGFRF